MIFNIIVKKGEKMKIYKTKLVDMDDYYLVALLTNGNYKTDLEKVKEELVKRLEEKSVNQLLLMWKSCQVGAMKELLEESIAIKYQSYEGSYETLPSLAKKYFEGMQSIEAITTLTYAKCHEINQKAMYKYLATMEEYLEYYDVFMYPLYEKEGSDLEMPNKKIIDFKKKSITLDRKESKEETKIYKITDYKSRRK